MPRWSAALALIAVLHGCAGGTASRTAAPASTTGATPSGAGAEPGAAPPSAAELEARYRARMDSALARYTEADVGFMAAMIGHHAQALEMANLVPSRSASPGVGRLAARIVIAQESEIGLMQQWLEERGRAAPAPRGPTSSRAADAADGAAAAPAHGGTAHATASPGMITAAEMGELAGLSGAGFDRLFLSYMIRHHEGAVRMVDDLFATPGAASDASTFRIASGVQVDQTSEITRMQSMLEALGRPGPPR